MNSSMTTQQELQISQIAANKAPSYDRATGVGLYNSEVQKTFLTYAGPDMDPTVMEYDHNKELFVGGPVVVGDGKKFDFNNYPKMVQDDTGRLIVVWTDHNNALYMSRNSRSNTVKGNWIESEINTDKNAYPCIIKASNGDLYIFYRKTIDTDYRPLRFVKSTDNGETWSSPLKAVDSGGFVKNRDSTNVNEIYFDCPRHEPAHDDIPERFAMGWTNAGGGINSTTHNNYHKDVFFAYFYPDTHFFSNVNGKNLGNSIDFDDMKTCLVLDSGPLDIDNPRAIHYYFAPSYMDGTGYPVMVYSLDNQLIAAKWNGKSWTQNTILSTAGKALFDIEKTGPTSFRLVQGNGGLQVFETSDGGTSWTESIGLKSTEGDIGRVLSIESSHPDLRFIAFENFFKNTTKDDYKVWAVGLSQLKVSKGFYVTEVTANKAPSADRATGTGLYDAAVKRTFIVYSGPGMDPMVMEFNHNDEHHGFTFGKGPLRVGEGKQPDFHNYAKMVQDDTGRLIVVWTDHNKALYMSKSSQPHMIEGRWTESEINTDKNTYPCIIKASNGDLYIFYRKTIGTDYRPLSYVKSSDNGETWGSPRWAIDSGGFDNNQDPTNVNEVYSDCPRHEPAHDGIPERFMVGWTNAGGGTNSTTHNVFHKDVYFAYFYPATLFFTNVNGTSLGNSIDYEGMKSCLVFDSGPLDPDNPQIVDYYFAPSYLDGTGYPVIVYNYNSKLSAAKWNGTNWTYSTILSGSENTLFDIEKTGPESFRVIQANGGMIIFESFDGGSTWLETLEQSFPKGSINKVFKVENSHPDIQYLAFAGKLSDPDYSGTYQVYTVGDTGLYVPSSKRISSRAQGGEILSSMALAVTVIALSVTCLLVYFGARWYQKSKKTRGLSADTQTTVA